MRRHATKRRFLTDAGAWNERARFVESPRFAQSDFFDPRDKVQVKYEMLRAHAVDGETISVASRQCGYSRESFYTAMDTFRAEGVTGLADSKRGPKAPRKLTSAVRAFICRETARTPQISSQDLVDRIKEDYRIEIHRRSIERFRKDHAAKKPPRRRRPR